MPAYTAHTVRMVNAVTMRTLYVQPHAATGLPDRCHTVAISDLLRQLILCAMDVTGEYAADSRDGRLMGLILDELNSYTMRRTISERCVNGRRSRASIPQRGSASLRGRLA